MIAGTALFATLHERLAVRPLVVLLDVDGTLAPIAPTPAEARVPDATRAAVAQLVAAPGVHVALVSGRASRDAHRMVGVDGVWAVGNHGFERLTPAGQLEDEPSAAPWRDRIAVAAAAAAPVVASWDGALLEDKRWTLSVHHRQAPPDAEPALRDALTAIAIHEGLVLTGGKKVFEIRPPVRIDKGSAAVALVRQLGGDGGVALYAGDDRTDEDAFVALRDASPGAVTIRVGSPDGEAAAVSAAEFLLPDVGAMQDFLVALAAAAGSPPSGGPG